MAERPTADEARRIVRCPGCGGEGVYALSNPFRPFCSERCRLADLGAWASEGYRVAAAPPVDDGKDDDDPAAADAD
ncbi:MAG TPA: DNA gyrase inhibitor YacG [Caldimonas sp.]|nr:DNA gyrase inhibitor YacG [Caldimonas sp.]